MVFGSIRINDMDNFDTNPSLDRINPNEDYNENNVRWVINCVNTFKGRLNDHELYKLAKGIVNVYESRKPT